MLKSLLFTTACLSVPALAQQQMQADAIPGSVKDAGVYHVATGTWTRGASATANFGPKVLFSNNAPSGYYGSFGAVPQTWYGVGRIPTTSDAGHPNAKADYYDVDGFLVGYCVSDVAGAFSLYTEAYVALRSCQDPFQFSPVQVFSLVGFPGGPAPGTTGCWLVTVDLAATSFDALNVPGDQDGTYDGTGDLDTFGIGFGFRNAVSGGCGPILTGDPNNFPYGDGTYYQNPGATNSTGLGVRDQFYLYDPTGGTGNGCYWFGGYPGGNPFSAFWLELYGDNVGVDVCTKVCVSNPSSAGPGAHIEFKGDNGDGTWKFSAELVPNQPGIFFHAPNGVQIPFGNGYLCAGGGLVRGGVVFAANNRAEDDIDVSALSGTRYFQYWFRDPAGGGAAYNTSNAVCCDF